MTSTELAIAHKVLEYVIHQIFGKVLDYVIQLIAGAIGRAFTNFCQELIASVLSPVETTIKVARVVAVVGVLALCAGGIFIVYRCATRPQLPA